MITKKASRSWAVAVVAASVLLAACSGADPDETERVAPPKAPVESNPKKSTTKPSNEPIEPGGLEAPPPVTLHSVDRSIDLHAWTYCYRDGCVDGAPPADPPNVGDPAEVVVEFPLPEWSFKASFSPAHKKCGRLQTVPLEVTDEGDFLLRPAGFAGTYDVTLTGRGDGDLFTTFRWTTPSDGPLPEPRARLAVLANQDGGVGSYGVELMVANLAQTPRNSSATITVESSDGNALEFKATPSRGRCFPEGTVYWDGPDDKGLAATSIGDRPFRYKVELMLEGERYVATAIWPVEEIPGNAPSVSLEFTPSLPALS